MIIKRILSGIQDAAWPAAACALLAIAIYVVDAQGVAKSGAPTLAVLIVYYVGAALAAGAILGLARPLARSAFGLAVVAFLTALPPAFLVMVFSRDGRWQDLNSLDVGIAVMLAAVFGPLTGAYLRMRQKQGQHD